MEVRARPYSRLTLEGLTLLARQIRLARKQRKLSESDLATRAGIARSTLQLIEKADPRVEVGLVFETAVIAGVSLFESGATTLAPRISQIDDKLALLPKKERRPRRMVKDDF